MALQMASNELTQLQNLPLNANAQGLQAQILELNCVIIQWFAKEISLITA